MGAEWLVSREINIHSFLNHPNILKLYGFFHDDDNIYMILEYANQGDLYNKLNEMPLKWFDEKSVKKILRDVI